MACSSSAPRSVSNSRSRPLKSANTSAPPASVVAPSAKAVTWIFRSSLAVRITSWRNFCSDSAAAVRLSLPSSKIFRVIGDAMRPHILRQVSGYDSGFLAALGFHGSGLSMRSVQPPLLPDADQAAGQDVYRKAAGNWEEHEHRRKRDGHELHHHLLLRIGGGHRRHFRNEVHRRTHNHRQNKFRVARGKIGDPPEPRRMPHLDCRTESAVQSEPDWHLHQHLEAAAHWIDAFSRIYRHHFLIHLRFARI